ncbi:hypothetical protein [Fodinicola feengrottensis]|nr:hypothetical protein [Fodinicola feengrottensis]
MGLSTTWSNYLRHWDRTLRTTLRRSLVRMWRRSSGDTGDLMVLMGWSSEEMASHYGASAAAERAQQTRVRMRIGENV